MCVKELALIQRVQVKIARQAKHEQLLHEIEDQEQSLEVEKAWLLTLLRQSLEELELAARDFIELCKITAEVAEKLE